ncbi:ATPase, T2SS/T4P/T4SS family [Fructobacillus durionis]|uniref:Competence protein ComGA n=1 Tax=Fructobacillus durionis TaxID=283737 RepID=A0A1I1DTX9_9LACO|nr:ATPase, T2SS/T4P/T4SS family [Fructobacillus durionis]SFB77882.1 competence protein ComGA [Fructobacillus durionis]
MNKERKWPQERGESVKDYLEKLLTLAFEHGFSDLYFLPKENGYAITGQRLARLESVGTVSNDFARSMLSLMKYWSNLNLAEERRPQLGRFDFAGGFVRVSSVGDFLDRESVVLRLIAGSHQDFQFSSESTWKELLSNQPESGLYLLAGPTGSGKTTMMYELLKHWSEGQVVLTVEDPVEMAQKEFLQLQVNEQAGITYQELIKVALRHRPDILVIGEVRDGQTAEAALQAALSGHLVIATIHANSAELVLERLVDLGLKESLVREALVQSLYMRLEPGSSGELQSSFTRVDWREKRRLYRRLQHPLNKGGDSHDGI